MTGTVNHNVRIPVALKWDMQRIREATGESLVAQTIRALEAQTKADLAKIKKRKAKA